MLQARRAVPGSSPRVECCLTHSFHVLLDTESEVKQGSLWQSHMRQFASEDGEVG